MDAPVIPEHDDCSRLLATNGLNRRRGAGTDAFLPRLRSASAPRRPITTNPFSTFYFPLSIPPAPGFPYKKQKSLTTCKASGQASPYQTNKETRICPAQAVQPNA